MDSNLKFILQEMLFDFENNKLEVCLVPQKDPPNIGACLRMTLSSNCEWYKNLCSDFPSRRKRQYRNFKTAVKRKYIEKILTNMIDGKPTTSKYAEWILNYTNREVENLNIEEVPF